MSKKPKKPIAPAVTEEKSRVEKLREFWIAEAAKFAAGEGDDGVAAGFWLHYPSMMGILRGCSSESPADELYTTEQSLYIAHQAAGRCLMKAAEVNGIDSGPIWQAMSICRRLVAERLSISGPIDTWPDCFCYSIIPSHERAIIDAGDAAFMRLVAKMEIAIPPRPAPTFSKADLREITGLENSALTDYTKAAGVEVPNRGAKNHRYTCDEFRKILEEIVRGTQSQSVRQKCDGKLKTLSEIAV